ncbi:MAG TPA: GWxTD domain-containing protein [Candidatus Acidoferrales bacterium]|nr:GWxTD domain-containing protein [Candidatus Acidoferrales bacterium]
MEKIRISGKIRPGKKLGALLKSTLSVLAMSFAVIGCAPQTKTFTSGAGHAFASPRFGFSIVNYPSESSDSTEGDLRARIRYSDLIFIKTDSLYTAHYQLSISLYSDEQMTESRYSKTFDHRITARKYSETTSSRMYDSFQDSVTMQPGRYYLTLRLLDLNTNTTLSSESECYFKDFFRDSVDVSDVLVYNSPDTNADELVVNPGEPLLADFYLTAKRIPTDISLHLIAKSTEAPTSIDTTYELNQISTVQHYRLPVNASGLGSAVYDLRISAGGDFAETSFKVMRSNSPGDARVFDRDAGPLAYIMAHGEFDSLQRSSRKEKDKEMKAFWLTRARDDTVVAEAIRGEFYKRVQEADEQFGTSLGSGWQTDRGRIYILYGKPDRIESHLNSLSAGPSANSAPYQAWYYDKLKLRFVFVDEFRNGNYRLAKTGGT